MLYYLLSSFVGIRPMMKKSEEKKATKAVSERLSRSQFQHMIATKAEAIKYTVFFIPQKIKLLISVAKIRLHAEILLPSIKENFIFMHIFKNKVPIIIDYTHFFSECPIQKMNLVYLKKKKMLK